MSGAEDGSARVFDDRPCALGEGPLWHPERGALFWFDILGQRLLAVLDGAPREWRFDEPVSAAGWIDRGSLLVASATGLQRLELDSDRREPVAALEADRPETRSNDGRADPRGGFWIGTMARDEGPGAGAIYRYRRGELRRLYDGLSIPNAICFAPDGRYAYFTDTPRRIVCRVALDGDGWPDAAPEDWLDLTGDGLNPDGAVTDAAGNLWLAQWGAGRVACHAPDGRFLRAVAMPAPQTTCPAFGGPGLSLLFCTSARKGLDAAALAATPLSGRTFAFAAGATGRPEPKVIP